MAIESISQTNGTRSGRSLGEFSHYDDAQDVVDTLSDREYPVQNLVIVGKGVELREQITGRITTKRSTVHGLVNGLISGTAFGLLFGLFLRGPAFVAAMAYALVFGGVFGAVWGALRPLGGKRDFTSAVGTRARTYEVQAATDDLAEEAERVLRRQTR